MIGDGVWACGIYIDQQDDGTWTVRVAFEDDGFIGDDRPAFGVFAVAGQFGLRYPVASEHLANAIDTVKADAEHLGIRWTMPYIGWPDNTGTIYAAGDREDLRPVANLHAERIGWQGIYADGRHAS